jgi:hypothetical protein
LTSGFETVKLKKVQLSLNVVSSSGHVEPSGKSAALIQKARTVNALVAADSVLVTRSELRWIASETHFKLAALSREVREGKNVLYASQFARWLEFSGLVRVLELVSDGVSIQKELGDLLFECGELFKGGKHDAKYAASDIAEINRKLDLLLSQGGHPVDRLLGEV